MQNKPTTASDTALPDEALSSDTTRSLPIALLRGREAVMSHFRPMLAQHDLTAQQWRIIRLLHEHGTLDAADLAEKAFILPPSLTRILVNLENRGLVLRSRTNTDRRKILLDLTEEGSATFRKIAPDSRRIYQAIEKSFGKQRVELLLELLQDLAKFQK